MNNSKLKIEISKTAKIFEQVLEIKKKKKYYRYVNRRYFI